ncbi:hypothetical protein ACC691_40760, partial [Rhizobium johnstonii]|uniref:hypothetical protein n=1 Tax=Rhizobium johnstonii TaxID=3019933 RepID=UPI003F98F363
MKSRVLPPIRRPAIALAIAGLLSLTGCAASTSTAAVETCRNGNTALTALDVAPDPRTIDGRMRETSVTV